MKSMLLLLAAVLAGLHAGFFFTWSFSVMNGLDAAAPGTAIAAMQAMNANIRNAPFGMVFFGAPVVALAAAALLLIRRGPGTLAALLGFAGLAATVAITAALHVPMNEALASARAGAPDAMSIWAAYSDTWTDWNHVRFATSLFAAVCLLIAFRAARAPG